MQAGEGGHGSLHPLTAACLSRLSVWWCHLPHVPLPDHRGQPPADPGADGRKRAVPARAAAVCEAPAGGGRSQVRPRAPAVRPFPEESSQTGRVSADLRRAWSHTQPCHLPAPQPGLRKQFAQLCPPFGCEEVTRSRARQTSCTSAKHPFPPSAFLLLI